MQERMPSDLKEVHKSDLFPEENIAVSQMSFTEADASGLNQLVDVIQPANESL